MAYKIVLNKLALPTSDQVSLMREFDALKADLVAIRASMAGLLAKLDLDGTVTDTNYAALWAPAASTFTAT